MAIRYHFYVVNVFAVCYEKFLDPDEGSMLSRKINFMMIVKNKFFREKFLHSNILILGQCMQFVIADKINTTVPLCNFGLAD